MADDEVDLSGGGDRVGDLALVGRDTVMALGTPVQADDHGLRPVGAGETGWEQFKRRIDVSPHLGPRGGGARLGRDSKSIPNAAAAGLTVRLVEDELIAPDRAALGAALHRFAEAS